MTPIGDPKPGFKWPVAVMQPIAASAERVWEAISSPGNLESCHPFCASNPVKEWPGEGARDEVHYLSGWIFERRFCRWIDGVGYDLEIGRHEGRSSLVSWRILSLDSQQCNLRIAVYPHALQKVPVVLVFGNKRLRVVCHARTASAPKPVWKSPMVFGPQILTNSLGSSLKCDKTQSSS